MYDDLTYPILNFCCFIKKKKKTHEKNIFTDAKSLTNRLTKIRLETKLKKVIIFFCSEKFQKIFVFFISILPNYVPHEITKEFWKNSHFGNMTAGFLPRCKNSLRWEICLICHWNIDSLTQKLSLRYVMVPENLNRYITEYI